MKKIIGILGAAAVLASSAFAADFSARAEIGGDIAKGAYASKTDEASINFLSIDDDDVKDSDLLQASFSGDRAGAQFKFFGSPTEKALTMRDLNVWFQPIDGLKVSLGNASDGLGFKEKIGWWRVSRGKSIPTNTYSYTAATIYGGANGVFSGGVEFTGIEGLTAIAGFGVGSGGSSLWSIKGDSTEADWSAHWNSAEWGVGAKYSLSDLGITVGVAYNDVGRKQEKKVTVGASLSSGALFGFVQGIINIDWKAGGTDNARSSAYYIAKAVDDTGKVVDDYSIVDWGIRGIAIDNYVEYNFGFMNLQAAVPVTIRFGDQHTGTRNYCDPSYMTWNVKVSIPQDFGTLYILCNSGGTSGDPEALVLTDYTSENFGIMGKVGVNVSVGSAAIDVGVWVGVQRNEYAWTTRADNSLSIYGTTNINWGIPFSVAVSF